MKLESPSVNTPKPPELSSCVLSSIESARMNLEIHSEGLGYFPIFAPSLEEALLVLHKVLENDKRGESTYIREGSAPGLPSVEDPENILQKLEIFARSDASTQVGILDLFTNRSEDFPLKEIPRINLFRETLRINSKILFILCPRDLTNAFMNGTPDLFSARTMDITINDGDIIYSKL